MSAVTFVLTNAVGLWVSQTSSTAANDMKYTYVAATQMLGGIASTTLNVQFTAPDGTVLQACTVTGAQITTDSLPLPCTMTITLMNVGGTDGAVIAVQDFLFGGPGAAAGAVFYPSPLFRAITTTIGPPSLSTTPTMAVTCTGAGYFALNSPPPAWSTTLPGTGFEVLFSLAGTWAPGKQFTVALDVLGTDLAFVTNQKAPFGGDTFVLSAGTPTYQLYLSATTLTLAIGTDVKFTLSSGACYKAAFFMSSQQFQDAPIVDDTGAICGSMTFKSNCTATTCGAFVVTLTGNWQAPAS
jgi:hypothetical protein